MERQSRPGDPSGVVRRAFPESLIAPDPDLFHEGHDPHDRKLGAAVARDTAAYDKARIVLIGCPQDVGVRRNRGRPGSESAPREIRRQLYRLAAPDSVADGALLDAGDVDTAPCLEEIHERQRRVVGSMLEHGKRVIVLGGGNDVSYPDVSALSQFARGKVLAFNIDRHFDVRESHHAHSGTPYRQLLEERRLEPGNLYQMGRTPGANSPAYERYLDRKGVPHLSLKEIREIGVEKSFRSVLHRRAHEVEAVFWGFDMDAVRSADAPGVSAGYPVGFTAAEVCDIAAEAGRTRRTRILEISECNPEQDIDGRTAKLAAMMIVSYLEALDPETLDAIPLRQPFR